MKKILCLLLVCAMLLGLTACGECDHDWEKATCEEPRTCSKCGETKGEPEDEHDWEEDDGEMVCSWCGEECDHEFEDGECQICGMEDPDFISEDASDPDDEELFHGGSEADAITGQWLLEVTVGEELTGMEGFSIDRLPLLFTFDGQGTMTMTFYEPYMEEAVARIEDGMYDYLEVMITETFAEQGFSMEDIDAMFQSQYGMTLEEFIVSAIKEQDMYGQLLAMKETVEYSFDGETLILDGVEMTVSIDGDELMIVSCLDPEFWAAVGKDIPVILRRVG